MLPQRPSADTEMRLMNKQYVSTVLYMEGNTLDHKDLKRCLIEKARTVVILSDKLTHDASSIDTHTILQAMVIKNYLKANKKSKSHETSICMQLLKQESITHYGLSHKNKEEIKNDQIVCIE
jgi:hypothetical protein